MYLFVEKLLESFRLIRFVISNLYYSILAISIYLHAFAFEMILYYRCVFVALQHSGWRWYYCCCCCCCCFLLCFYAGCCCSSSKRDSLASCLVSFAMMSFILSLHKYRYFFN